MCESKLQFFKIGASLHIYGLFKDFFTEASASKEQQRRFSLPVPNNRDYVIRCHKLCCLNLSTCGINAEDFVTPAVQAACDGDGLSQSIATVCFGSSANPNPLPLNEGCVFPLDSDPYIWYESELNLSGTSSADIFGAGFLHIEICPREWNMGNIFLQSNQYNASYTTEAGLGVGTYSFGLIGRNATVIGTNQAAIFFPANNQIAAFQVVDLRRITMSANFKTAHIGVASAPCGFYLTSGFALPALLKTKVLKAQYFPDNVGDLAGLYAGYSSTIDWEFPVPISAWRAGDQVNNSIGKLLLVADLLYAVDRFHISAHGQFYCYPNTQANYQP